jgi:hypothetical protein
VFAQPLFRAVATQFLSQPQQSIQQHKRSIEPLYYTMVQFLSLALMAGLSAVASAIPTIEVKGSKFFTSEGNQFFVKGKHIGMFIYQDGY